MAAPAAALDRATRRRLPGEIGTKARKTLQRRFSGKVMKCTLREGHLQLLTKMNRASVMERVLSPKTLPDVSPEERVSSELVKRIRKLRWIGMEREAQRLQTPLCGELAGVTLARSRKKG